MTETSPPPSRLLRTVARVAQWLWALALAAGLLLGAAWAALHGWIVPRIGDYREQLQAQATRALGMPVQIGRIVAHTEGLIPSIELGQVALLDAQGREVLQLSRVVLALSPRSLWRWGFEQLYIEGPQLQVRRSPSGQIFVAGLPLSASTQQPSALADWLFAQPEVVVRGGALHWVDEQRDAPPLTLENVDVLLRNGAWRHRLRVDATPPPGWGERFSVTGLFRQRLLSTHSGRWQDWSGQLFANFTQLDVSPLQRYADLGIDLAQGQGALRAWLDIERGQWTRVVTDVALQQVNATLATQLEPLGLAQLQGRLQVRRLPVGWEAASQGLQFATDDGVRWPGGNVRVQIQPIPGRERGELHADQLDLATLARIGQRLPLGDALHAQLHSYAPHGLVEWAHATWQGPYDAPRRYDVRGKVSGLTLGDTAAAARAQQLGLRNATLELQANETGGKASIGMRGGALLLPGVFEDPELPLQHLSGDVRWQIDGQRWSVQVNNAQFANADAQGQARARWHTSDPARSGSGSRFPGVLDLSGTLSRAEGARVHRYLPLAIAEDARHYVRDAVVAGSASRVDFKVKGDLHDMPFSQPRQGEFRIAAQVKGVTYVYVPPRLQMPGEPAWPALTQLDGELVFERASMRVQGAQGRLAGTQQTRLTKVQAHIPDLAHTVVTVQADTRGPLPELLAFLRTSPLDAMIGHALSQATGNGPADMRLRLHLPIDKLDKSQVQGSVVLAGNDVRITPDTPALSKARGTVHFSESGFTLQGIQARALGGEVRLEGGMRALPAGTPASESALQLRAQGTASAQGLQQATELGPLAQWARHASGTAPYSVNIGLRRGVPQVQVQSSLQGLALALPPPLGKTTDSSLPLRFETQLTPESLAPQALHATPTPLHEHMSLDAGKLGRIDYVRDLSAPTAQVLRGAIAIGLAAEESAPLPAQGVAANVQLAAFDIDAWSAVLHGDTVSDDHAPAYLPTTVALRAQTLVTQGRTLHHLVAGASRVGGTWRVTLQADELNGHLEFRPANAPTQPGARLYARLSRLTVPPSAVTEVETLLAEPPGQLPALDIAVDEFELRGRKLGRLDIEATHRSSSTAGPLEWRLHKFNLTTPEATLSASGQWARAETVLPFTLDIRDAGQLLARFGMANVVRQGKGQLQGEISWHGSPLSLDYPSLSGQIRLDVENGQFLQADPGLAKLLGVLSLQSLPRRLALDFRDVFSQGFAFDFVRGDVRVEHGVATTNNLQMKGVNAAVLMEGSAHIAKETQDLHVIVVPEINAMTASLVATAVNPLVGLGSFLAQMVLRGPLIAATTQEFQIDGTWTEPRVQRLRSGERTLTAPTAPPPPTGNAAP